MDKWNVRETVDGGFGEAHKVPPSDPTRAMSSARWCIFLALLVPFTILTYLAVSSGSPGDVRDRPIALTSLGTIAGPFTGAIARRGQGCCLAASLNIAMFCGPILATGVLFQLLPEPTTPWGGAPRLLLWACGWFVWFAGGTLSFLHALN